jgi:hypothetical protein
MSDELQNTSDLGSTLIIVPHPPGSTLSDPAFINWMYILEKFVIFSMAKIV